MNTWKEADANARDHLTSIVYAELHRLAFLRMVTESPGHVLRTSALVNEAFVRFMESSPRQWRDRSHFFAFMSRVMRQILVDFARSHRAAKRGDGNPPLDLSAADRVAVEPRFHNFMDLDIALDKLAQLHERQAHVVELRYFGGLENEEIAEVLGVSTDTVLRDWNAARACLFQLLASLPPS